MQALLVADVEQPQPGQEVREQGRETHYLLRCHRIALDFGPDAAQRALELYRGRSLAFAEPANYSEASHRAVPDSR
jgi:hypothetical protein